MYLVNSNWSCGLFHPEIISLCWAFAPVRIASTTSPCNCISLLFISLALFFNYFIHTYAHQPLSVSILHRSAFHISQYSLAIAPHSHHLVVYSPHFSVHFVALKIHFDRDHLSILLFFTTYLTLLPIFFPFCLLLSSDTLSSRERIYFFSRKLITIIWHMDDFSPLNEPMTNCQTSFWLIWILIL